MGGFIYPFFGTVKQVSIGPTSLMSLLTYEFTKNLPHQHVVLLTFMCGIVEMLMGLLKLGKLFHSRNKLNKNIQITLTEVYQNNFKIV